MSRRAGGLYATRAPNGYDERTRRGPPPRACAARDAGFGLVEMLIGVFVTLVLVGAIVATIGSLARAVVAHPVSADEQQRARAAFELLNGLIARAGERMVALGPGPPGSPLLLPVLYPQRRGVPGADPDTSASTTSITVVAGTDQPRASARLAIPMASVASPMVLDGSTCGPGRTACGFSVGSYALVADARACGEWFRVNDVVSGNLVHGALSATYSPAAFAQVVAVDVRAVWLDAAQGQLRLSSPGSDVPLLDDVEGFEVQWFGDRAPPRVPAPPPGEENCLVSSAGLVRLPGLSATDGPWVRLRVDDLSDGPWCGQSPWRIDADLFRVRMVVVELRWRNSVLRSALRLGERVAPRLRFHVAPPNLNGG